MGLKLKAPKIKIGKNSVVGQVTKFATTSVTNPIGALNTAFGANIPTSVKIAGTSVGVNPLTQVRATLIDLKKTQKQAAVDRENAKKGEIGKFYSGQFDRINNLNPISIAEKTVRGQSLSTTLKKAGGSLLVSNSLFPADATTFAGKSSTFQRVARDKNTSKNTFGFSENFAGFSRGGSTLVSSGNLSNDDRNNIIQSYVKVGAVAGVGGWLNSLFSGAPAPAAGGASEGAVVVESGTPFAGTGAVSSADIAAGAGTSAFPSAAAPVAAGGSGWFAQGSTAALAYSALFGGKGSPSSIGDIFTGGGINPGDSSGGLLDQIGNLFRGDGGGDISFTDVPVKTGLLPTGDREKMFLLIGAAAALGYYLWRRYA